MSSAQAIGSLAIPLYAQVEAALAASIADGTFAPGTQLPTEAGLEKRFGVSRPTVRKAIQNLSARGLVEVRRGNGTFAARPPLTQETPASSGLAHELDLFLDAPSHQGTVQREGEAPAEPNLEGQMRKTAQQELRPPIRAHAASPVITARVIGNRILPADKTAARELGISTWDLTVRFDRLRLRDGLPFSIDEIHLPFPLGDGVTAADIESMPLASVLEQKLGVPLVSAKYVLQAVPAEPAVAEALGIVADRPIFLIERTLYTESHRAILYEKLQCRGDLVRLVTCSRN